MRRREKGVLGALAAMVSVSGGSQLINRRFVCLSYTLSRSWRIFFGHFTKQTRPLGSLGAQGTPFLPLFEIAKPLAVRMLRVKSPQNTCDLAKWSYLTTEAISTVKEVPA